MPIHLCHDNHRLRPFEHPTRIHAQLSPAAQVLHLPRPAPPEPLLEKLRALHPTGRRDPHPFKPHRPAQPTHQLSSFRRHHHIIILAAQTHHQPLSIPATKDQGQKGRGERSRDQAPSSPRLRASAVQSSGVLRPLPRPRPTLTAAPAASTVRILEPLSAGGPHHP